MKIAIMQPYFFPYLGYFQLIKSVDRFIIGDCVQYINKGWINRNRILTPDYNGWSYITVPVAKHNHTALITDVYVSDHHDWKSRILSQLDHYKRKLPYYKEVYSLLSDCFTTNEKSISKLNAGFIKAVCDYIGLNFIKELQSEMNLDYLNETDRECKIIKICRKLGATEYINLPGGMELYKNEKFCTNNIKLSFLQPGLRAYKQNEEAFQSGLSIIDVMMFNSRDDIKKLLNEYQIVSPQ